MSKLAVLLVLTTLTSGCYLGRSRDQKTTASVINGALIVGGAALIATSGGNDCPPDADVSCGVGTGMAAAAQVGLGSLLALAGGVGLLVNAAVETAPDPRVGAGPVPAPAATSSTATVTAPGLAPATIELR